MDSEFVRLISEVMKMLSGYDPATEFTVRLFEALRGRNLSYETENAVVNCVALHPEAEWEKYAKELYEFLPTCNSEEEILAKIKEIEGRTKAVIIMIGIQGSGKSEFCRQFLQEYKYISLDELHTRNKEQIAIDSCFTESISFVIDNTNPTISEREKYISQAKENGYRIIGYFMESKLQPCIERNNKREGKAKIPSKAIAATSNKLELPDYSEGFDELYFVHNNGETMTIEEWKK